MHKISMEKKYRTRNGQEVRVLCVDRNDHYPVIALVNNQQLVSYTEHGYEYEDNYSQELDLIGYDPAEDLVLDQVIWVRVTRESTWVPRHFSHYENQTVYAFVDGRSSKTNQDSDGVNGWYFWTATKPE